MTAAALFKGTWHARWGNWAIFLHSAGDRWDVRVWRWAPSTDVATHVEIDAWDGFYSQEEAVTFACDVMRNDGAKVMVLGANKPMTIEALLRFAPALAAVA